MPNLRMVSKSAANPTSTPATTDPVTQLNLHELRDTVEVQQRSIRFLLTNWDAMVSQVTSLGAPQTFNNGLYIPNGVWRSLLPVSGVIANATVQGVSTTISAPGPFVSDGTASASYPGGITVVRSTPPPTPLP